MQIVIHLYFNLSKLLFSSLGRRKLVFVPLELLFSVVTILLSFIIKPQAFFFGNLKTDTVNLTGFLIYSLFFGLLYVLSSFFSRHIIKERPVENITSDKNNMVWVGIVDFSWLVLIGLTYAGVLLVNNFDIVIGKIPSSLSIDYYKLYYDELKYIFDQTWTILLALGTVLAGCMAIIWSGAIWRKGDEKSSKHYKATTITSIRMVIAYLIIVLSIIIWISLPIYQKLTIMKEFIK